MKQIVKIVYHYKNGKQEEFTRQHDYEKDTSLINWAPKCRRNKQEQEEYEKRLQETIERLNNIDPSIFPENLFTEEENKQ